MGYRSYAEAVGESPHYGLSFVPGEDFDPSDPDDCAAVRLAMENDVHDRTMALHRENDALRREIAELREMIADLSD